MDKKLLKKIERKNWYKQGGAILAYYTSAPYKFILQEYDGFDFFKKGINNGYFDRDLEKKNCDSIIKQQLKNKDYIFRSMIVPWNKLRIQQDKLITKINPEDLNKADEKQFLKIYNEFHDLREKLWKIGINIETFDPWGESIIKEYLSKYHINISDEDLSVLISPDKKNFIQKENLGRLFIAKKLQKGKDIEQDVKEHTNNYFWIHNSWAAIHTLHYNYFMNEIKRDLKKDLEKDLNEILAYEKNIKKKKSVLLKKYSLSGEIISLLFFFSPMTDWRDERKAQAMKLNYYADLFLVEISKRTNIPYKYLSYIDESELTSFKDLKDNKENIMKRPDGCVCYRENNKLNWILGKESDGIFEAIEKKLSNYGVLKGKPANKGVVKGKVKIIVTKEEFSKMNQGDILVTHMTRPEYMPILKKAAAIVTDEGGITCHAAIVARELNIPCVIGTQNATSSLKDNDYVEVDADKGIVRIIKKASITNG